MTSEMTCDDICEARDCWERAAISIDIDGEPYFFCKPHAVQVKNWMKRGNKEQVLVLKPDDIGES